MEQKNTNIKVLLVRASIFAVLVVALFILRPAILGGSKTIKLQTAPSLTGQVSQSFTSADSHTLPIAGQDYELQNVNYFDDNQWVVATVHQLKVSSDDAVIIMKKTNDMYTPVLGPGSAFSSTVTEGLPSDVNSYLEQLGVFYDAAG